MLCRPGWAAALVFSAGCAGSDSEVSTTMANAPRRPAPDISVGLADSLQASTETADVLSVRVQGSPGAYSFSVEVQSPDTGCERYADWWEVVSVEGKLIYRRILLHSHVDEQPFVRSGGSIGATADEMVYVRAHLNSGGYGRALRGTAEADFEEADLAPDFAAGLQTAPPQPSGCAF